MIYYVQHSIGKARHVVSYHDGIKKHGDGSPFFDVKICGNKKRLSAFISKLKKLGYT